MKRRLVCFLLHLSSAVAVSKRDLGFEIAIVRPAVSGLAALWCSDFPLLRPDFKFQICDLKY